jgi:hypothetical protein
MQWPIEELLKMEASLNRKLFKWSRREVEQEVASDYARVRKVKNYVAARFLRFVSAMDSEERMGLMDALVKRAYATRHLHGGDLTRMEEHMVERYLAFESSKPISERDYRMPTKTAAERRSLRSVLKPRLVRILGQPATEYGANEWDFSRSIQGFQVVTYVDLRYKFAHLRYHHALRTADGGTIWQGAFLGIVGIPAETSWVLTDQQEVEEVVDTACNFVESFHESMERLL